MDKQLLRNFILDTERLLTEFNLLKEHAVGLIDANRQLKKDNIALKLKNQQAQTSVKNIIQRLEEAQQ